MKHDHRTPDLFAGKAGRDEGMALVMEHAPDFAYAFHHYVLNLPSGWIGKCEDIRAVWVGPLPKPQAWGACWNAEVKRGLLIEMSDEVHMADPRSHARKTHLYRRR